MPVVLAADHTGLRRLGVGRAISWETGIVREEKKKRRKSKRKIRPVDGLVLA